MHVSCHYRQSIWEIRVCWAEPENNEDEIDALGKAYALLCGEPFKFAEGGQNITPELIIVDSGYRTKAIYEFCAGHHGIVPGKGFDKGMAWGRFAKANRQTPLIQGTAAAWRPWLVNVDTYACKEALYRWASRSGRGPGTFHCHFLALDDDAYIKQFTSEHLVEDKGKLVWKTKTQGRANHYLDVEVYALAAAELVGALYLTPVSPPERQGTVQDGAERHHPRSRSKMGGFGRRPLGLTRRLR